ncbi:MAG: 50S ribosomal protein L21e [Candidatus Methanoperedens sp.]|jgi:large subunit ribosomal protein L21e|nr:50S ribosomal protein L21e [Candidatus Methanoperedens sp.]PKL54228.1 MAG: 50S ribosomal protein L21e [Candidatus Methanoperedenaceae archaeon HGW-Methanoperedenaceae-1]
MAKTHGTRRKSRYKLKKTVREKGLSTITRAIQQFTAGDIVNIDLDPGIQNGMPHHKFHGKTGKVVGQRGRAYLVGVRDGNSMKEVIVLPEHLTTQK